MGVSIGQIQSQDNGEYLSDLSLELLSLTTIDLDGFAEKCVSYNGSFDVDTDYQFSFSLSSKYDFDFEVLLMDKDNVYSQLLQKGSYKAGKGAAMARTVLMFQDPGSKRTITGIVGQEITGQDGSYLYGGQSITSYSETIMYQDWDEDELDNTDESDNTNSSISYSCSFRPYYEQFTKIVIQIVRKPLDYSVNSGNGRALTVTEYSLNVIKNLLTGNPSPPLQHIGVWGRSGLPLVINGEEIRIGKSQYYELEGIDIETLGVVAKKFPEDRFTIDYQYEVNN